MRRATTRDDRSQYIPSYDIDHVDRLSATTTRRVLEQGELAVSYRLDGVESVRPARPVSAWAAPAQPIARLPCRLAGDEAG
jgi:hypothetical protein